MPKYLVRNTYTEEGMRGVLDEGGSSRRDAAAGLVESLGGTLESLYFVDGGAEVVLIVDLPDKPSTVAAVATVVATGAMGTGELTPLMTPEEIDEGVKLAAAYRPPGS